MKKSKFIIMNGRWGHGYKSGQHIYVCAKNIADAARILKEVSGSNNMSESQWRYEIKKYFNIGCWGNSMSDIVPERGAWITMGYPEEKPVRVFGK